MRSDSLWMRGHYDYLVCLVSLWRVHQYFNALEPFVFIDIQMETVELHCFVQKQPIFTYRRSTLACSAPTAMNDQY